MSNNTENSINTPKVFISYSWTNQNHMDWVVQLSTDLRRNGVDVILDRWHLKEGNDAHSFMEQMIRDKELQKVILVCDKKYVDRANTREGGVGIESQIITSNIYGDVEQSKFVAVPVESDENGQACIPNFMKTRMFVDFRNKDNYAINFALLLRWIFDKPLYVMPEVGERPKFLDEQISFSSINMDGIRLDPDKLRATSQKFSAVWLEVIEKHTDFTLELAGIDDADQLVVDAINSFPPLISQLVVSIRDRLSDDDFSFRDLEIIQSFFEKCLANYRKGSTNWATDATKFFTQFVFVSVVALFLRFRRFDLVRKLLSTPLIQMQHESFTAKTTDISEILAHLPSLDHRNKRLSLRRVSLVADLTKDICEKIPLEFWEYLQADFVIFLFFDRSVKDRRWWPDSNIYVSNSYGSFPLFAKAIDPDIRSALMDLFDLDGADKITKFKEDLRSVSYRGLRWSGGAFSELNIWEIGNFEKILESFGAG